jgi:gamma-glutamylcyclotransferase (GGCT)/AIG2-like uncharacterized protein YtfP
MLYFAYGSNMSLKRFKHRVKTAKLIGQYVLLEHQLKFHKIGKDYSGKCDAYFTGNQKDKVFGMVFNFDRQEKSHLDRLEDLGIGYQEKKVSLVNQRGTTLEAYTYYAINIKSELKPFSWYKQHIIYGAKEANFPQAYLNYIINYPEMIDQNVAREKRELSIYS